MPWCDECSRFYNPNTLTADGDCPDGHQVAEASTEQAVKVPWHFWVMLAALGLYLGWRVVQGVGVAVGWLT